MIFYLVTTDTYLHSQRSLSKRQNGLLTLPLRIAFWQLTTGIGRNGAIARQVFLEEASRRGHVLCDGEEIHLGGLSSGYTMKICA